MKNIKPLYFLLFLVILVTVRCQIADSEQTIFYENYWTKPPSKIPNKYSVDAPLMGNGDVKMSLGFQGDYLRYYITKNDFWRLRSQSDNLSGPRMVGFMDIHIEGFEEAEFSAKQQLSNGVTTCYLNKSAQKIESKSWVSATDNILFIEIKAVHKTAKITINLTAPENLQAKVLSGEKDNIFWQTRAFVDSVDIASEVAVALKIFNYSHKTIDLKPGKKVVIALALESNFKSNEPLEHILNRMTNLSENSVSTLIKEHDKWWKNYWDKSSIVIEDSVLMKAYYQGLYTMAACSRDKKFPPGIFGWVTTDAPAWNGDYHLNYNFQAPFYALYSANRLEQGVPQDAPLLDFMPKGENYAKNITHTRGILYPVGIGPLGIDVTKNHPSHQNTGDMEDGGLFFGQRSNATYGLINMAQYWRCTYDTEYGKKIYPYALAVVNFWEDYLKLENGRYVIYGDAIHEGSGKDKNPILSLGLIRNAFDLILDLSITLKLNENSREKWQDILHKISEFPVQIREGRKVFRYTEEGIDWWDGNGLGIQHIYPANAITLDSNTELLNVARNTIDEMQRWQDNNTSSSFFMAAVRVGYEPSIILNEMHKYALHTYPNGFQLNNPHGIENSCTVVNAVNEMLCMSAGNVIRLFPVFPKNKNARFKNIRTWGAFLVSASLKNGTISDVKMISERGKKCTVVNPWPDNNVLIFRNGKEAETISGERISFETTINETVELKSI